MIGVMTRGRHALPPAAVRAWQAAVSPDISRRTALALMLAVAATAGSLLILAIEHGDLAGLAAAALLGLMALAGAACCPGQPARSQEQDDTRGTGPAAPPELLPAPVSLPVPNQGAAVPGLDQVYPG
jgi:hypothetical protein